jgi:hypothetical protein
MIEDSARNQRIEQARTLKLGPWQCELCDFASPDPLEFEHHLAAFGHMVSEGHLGGNTMSDLQGLAFTDALFVGDDDLLGASRERLDLARRWLLHGWRSATTALGLPITKASDPPL